MTNKQLIERMKDMANCADASYAELHCIRKNFIVKQYWNENNRKRIFVEEFGDNLTKGDKIIDDIKDDNDNILHKKDSNTTYARAIEARFCKEMLNDENKQIQSIKNISLQATLSHRTKNFVNRYELVSHIPNTLSGFSATVFRDLGELDTATNARKLENDFSYIITFRDTESTKEIV
ncbi:hypothetical protein [Helicobacter trogontum]|uniref:hypothetical protein n=1 Tax=Helicobacter trogontum TaxID=50960 RepID=UPI001F4720AF|nr:hypothetical protein [Helicobacter trogontum]